MRKPKGIAVLLLAVALTIGLAPGCDDDDPSGTTDAGQDVADDHTEDGHEHDLEAHVCEHFENGPFASVDAAADSSDTLENAAIAHTAVTVELVAITGGNGGWVSYAAAADAEFIFFLSADVPFAIYDAADAEVEIEHFEVGSESCSSIAAQHHVDLMVGTYKLSFGPTTETSVTLVAPQVDHDHEHE